MLEEFSTEFIVALGFGTAILGLVVGVFVFQLVISSRRLRQAHQLAVAAMQFSPALITLVLDEKERVIEIKMPDAESERYFRHALSGKKKDELVFLPKDLLSPSGALTDAQSAHALDQLLAPLKMPDDSILYLRWEMQNTTDRHGKSRFLLLRGHNHTEELLQTQNMLKQLAATVSEREERERRHFAEEIHDRLGEVTVSSTRLMRELKKKSPSPELHQGLEELAGIIQEFSRGTHSLIADLTPQTVYDLGLAAAVEAYADNFKKQNRLTLAVNDELQDARVAHDVAIFLYKAVKELLRNAVKHGGADEIRVTLSRTEQTVAVTVEDNGSGFEGETQAPMLSLESGFGLFNIKNRAEYYHGDLVTENSSELGGGKVTVWVTYAPRKEG